jgi:hypothetical protein
MPNISSSQTEEIRWASLDVQDSKGRDNKKEPNPDQKDIGLTAGTSVARNNYNYMFDKYHELFEQMRLHIDDLALAAASTNLEVIYPVGAIYLSTASTDPSTVFGIGTWEKIEDRFLLAGGSTYLAGSSGGSASHTHTDTFAVDPHNLTINEIPPHSHQVVVEDTRGTGISGASDGTSGTKIIETEETGNGQSHSHNLSGGIGSSSNLPPYLAVHVWKRTA